MYTKASFTDELKRIWTTITAFKPSWYKMGSQEVEITDAWKMYQNARQSTLDELLLGDVKLRSEIEVLKNFGTTSGSESTMERETLFDAKNKKVTSDDVQATVKSARGSAYQLPEGVTHIRRGSV